MSRKAVSFPLYYILDKKRPAPNFVVERITPETFALVLFTTIRAAGDYMEASEKQKVDFGTPNIVEISTEERLKGILGALLDVFPEVKFVCFDHKPPSRPKQTVMLPISPFLKQLSGKGH